MEIIFDDTRTEEEKVREEIAGYKQLLAQSDYKALKYAEGEISYEEYEPIRIYRQELRNKINILESEAFSEGIEL